MWATLPLRVAAMAGPQRAAASPGSMLGVPVSVLPVCAIIIVDSTVIFGYLALLPKWVQQYSDESFALGFVVTAANGEDDTAEAHMVALSPDEPHPQPWKEA